MRHPNIVPFLGISDILPVCLVSEWMAHGSIISFLRQNSSEDRLKYVHELFLPLHRMHATDLLNRRKML